jgi:hypothetical protein
VSTFNIQRWVCDGICDGMRFEVMQFMCTHPNEHSQFIQQAPHISGRTSVWSRPDAPILSGWQVPATEHFGKFGTIQQLPQEAFKGRILRLER